MTSEQEKHLQEILKDFKQLASSKYRKGQKEHGGNLFELPTLALLDRAIDEAIDQVIYLITMKHQIWPKKPLVQNYDKFGPPELD